MAGRYHLSEINRKPEDDRTSMAIPTQTLTDLRAALHREMLGSRVRIGNILIDDSPTSSAVGNPFVSLVQRKAGPNSERIVIRIHGWGDSLERKTQTWRTAIDPGVDPAVAIDTSISIMRMRIDRQNRLSGEAHAAGIERPMKDDALQSTAHLSVDVDSIFALVRFMGSRHAARMWIDEQMRLHFEDLTINADKPVKNSNISSARSIVSALDEGDAWPERHDLVVRIVGACMNIPFALKPLRPSRAQDDAGANVWEDDTVYLRGAVPETIAIALPGRPLGDLVGDTPIGHRIIHAVVDSSTDKNPGIAVLLEPVRAKLDDVLPKLSAGWI